MDCRCARELMNYGIDAELPPDKAQAFYRHISDCPSCARIYTHLSKLVKEAARCVVPEPPPNFWDDVWQHVRQVALDEKQPLWRSLRSRLRVLAIATALVLSTIIAVARFGGHGTVNLPVAEASSRHAIVLTQQPNSDYGLAMFAVCEANLADYHASRKEDQD